MALKYYSKTGRIRRKPTDVYELRDSLYEKISILEDKIEAMSPEKYIVVIQIKRGDKKSEKFRVFDSIGLAKAWLYQVGVESQDKYFGFEILGYQIYEASLSQYI